MKKVGFLILIVVSVFSAILVIANENGKKEEVPEGMEVLKAGNVRVIVPKGTKIDQKGNLITVEGISAYSARRFLEIEGRFVKTEERLVETKKRLTETKERLAETKGRLAETEGRLAGVEAREEGLREEVEQLKKALEEIYEKDKAQ
ncbi:MAG: hypothetical protein KKH11_01760 [Candidatus Omnitrophica bacterium]|nr:hypothetical protein [Candidatus Omnitrophota bacterium]MBU4140516.1 hypothetical protein [Candidatus Omnitrophota bacterium]